MRSVEAIEQDLNELDVVQSKELSHGAVPHQMLRTLFKGDCCTTGSRRKGGFSQERTRRVAKREERTRVARRQDSSVAHA